MVDRKFTLLIRPTSFIFSDKACELTYAMHRCCANSKVASIRLLVPPYTPFPDFTINHILRSTRVWSKQSAGGWTPVSSLFLAYPHCTLTFFDAGCDAESIALKNRFRYSIDQSVNDLDELIHSLQLKEFHLLGHSFGGIIAYEYLKTNDLESGCAKCLSLTLDSTPADIQMSLNECSRLECEIKSELMLEINDAPMNLVQDRLRKRNECRTEVLPQALATAIKRRGATFGLEAVSDYVALPPSKRSLPPVLLIRGQYDYITEPCIEGWRQIFTCAHTYREEEMINCAHYCHLEDAQRFGDLIKSHCFIHDY